MMIMLAMVGLLIVASVVGYGVWKLTNAVSFKKTTDRYKYEVVKDEEGNEITRVVDLEKERK